MPKYKIAKNKLPELRAKYDHRTKYDWLSARTEYIEGFEDEDGTIVWPSPMQISERFNIPAAQVRTFSSKEHWNEHRSVHQRQIAMERQKLHAKMLASKAVKFDETSVALSDLAKASITERYNQIKKLREMDTQRIATLVQMIEENDLEVTYAMRKELAPLVPASEEESLMKAAALADEIGRKALGMRDDDNKVNIEITQTTTNITESMQSTDEQRMEGFLQILTNKNFKIDDLRSQRDEALELDIIDVDDSDVKEITDGHDEEK